jgi:2-polyprenyl-3-methyl-5-hydroxy-6-metoxy-1,4-benzoquinol methylase
MLQQNLLRSRANAFRDEVTRIKSGLAVDWYPYDSLHNIDLMPEYVPENIIRQLETGALDWRVLDIGAGDGDVGFFFESLGCRVDMLDNPPTNFNDCRGISAYAEATGSSSKLLIRDIDRAFELEDQYDFALALGLLYHLRNPMNLLLTLALHAERLVLSTRVFRFLPDGTNIEKHPVAYFLRRREANDDPTNYWILSPLGLETMLSRCGWAIKGHCLQGAPQSNPVDNAADERMFVYAERVPNWQDLGKHHDF